MVYTSSSTALCALEILVHLGASIVPRDHVLIEIDVPDEITARCMELNPLPPGWDSMPESDEAKKAGTAWAKSQQSALLRVPSVIAREDWNYLINPLHPDTKKLTAAITRDFQFDPRMFR